MRPVLHALPGLALVAALSSCITATSRTCSSSDGFVCTAYTGIAWTESQVRDQCARTSANFAVGACAASPYGTCVGFPGGVTEAQVFTYAAPGLTEAAVESGCCSGGGANATWVSSSGARRPCGSGGGMDETGADGI